MLAFAQFIVAMDYNIVFVALPDIGRALGFSAQSLQWVLSAYAVGLGGFLLFGGRVVDRLGARRAFVGGLVLFGLACLAGGLAVDQGVLVAARAAQGLGGALLTPATLALIGSGFAEGPERNRALSVWGAAGSGGLAVGALLGGVLTDAWGWEWVLLVMVPFALGAAALAPFVLPPDGRGLRPRFHRPTGYRQSPTGCRRSPTGHRRKSPGLTWWGRCWPRRRRCCWCWGWSRDRRPGGCGAG
ncbi:MFS transporter [Actinosynnema sp. CA-248983]